MPCGCICEYGPGGCGSSTRTESGFASRRAVMTRRRPRPLRASKWNGNVAAIIPPAFAPEYKPRTRFLTRDELQKLLAELTGDRAARIAFIVATSACWSESDRARREHVAEDNSSVFIDGTK